MHIDLYTVCWNELRVLPFFLRHYEPLATRIVVFDDGSDDGSVEYLRRSPMVEVRPFRRSVADSFEASKRALQNQCWKESRGRADWVMIVDIDEHLYHPRLHSYLADCKARGITYIPAIGFTMFSEDFPSAAATLCDTARNGVRSAWMHKPALLDPQALAETRSTVGCHRAAPTGQVRYPAVDELTLLHYKHLGLDYLAERKRELKPRSLPGDLRKGWGRDWRRGVEEDSRYLQTLLALGRPVLPAALPYGLEGWADRWWRPQWPGFRQRAQARYLAAVRRMAPGNAAAPSSSLQR